MSDEQSKMAAIEASIQAADGIHVGKLREAIDNMLEALERHRNAETGDALLNWLMNPPDGSPLGGSDFQANHEDIETQTRIAGLLPAGQRLRVELVKEATS